MLSSLCSSRFTCVALISCSTVGGISRVLGVILTVLRWNGRAVTIKVPGSRFTCSAVDVEAASVVDEWVGGDLAGKVTGVLEKGLGFPNSGNF